MPFANTLELDIHFKKHGHKFGLATKEEYERLADAFMFGPMNASTKECIRPNGNDRLRFDFVTVHFGVASVAPEFVRTFYPVERRKVLRHGGSAGYFAYECARVEL
ncbi:MAG: hypothetical protein L0212_10450 [Acidobacteria bacterium]|nr:hypothetical protein [Acidobacteriota bacterium]